MKKHYLKFQTKKLTRKEEKQLFILFLAKLGFKSLGPSDKVTKARAIVTAMAGNPNFTTPSPSLASVTAAADALDAAQQALDGTKAKTLARNIAEANLSTLMSGLQGYVDAICMKDAEKVLSSGFDLRDPRTKATRLPAPIGITAESTQIEGEIELNWLSSGKTKLLYIVQAAIEGPSMDWQIVAESSKSKTLIENLQPGVKYYFRVAVINTAGISGWSEYAVCRPN